jgi:hypothetical protein
VTASALDPLQVVDRRCVTLVDGILLQDFAVADDRVQRRTQLVRHVGEEVRFGSIGLVGGVTRHFQFLYEVGQLGFVLFQFGDVGIDRDHAVVGGFSLADLDPTAVAAALDVHLARGVVALEAFTQPGIAASFRVPDQSPISGGADNRLKARPGYHNIRVRRKEFPIAGIAHDEFVFGIVKRETL